MEAPSLKQGFVPVWYGCATVFTEEGVVLCDMVVCRILRDAFLSLFYGSGIALDALYGLLLNSMFLLFGISQSQSIFSVN